MTGRLERAKVEFHVPSQHSDTMAPGFVDSAKKKDGRVLTHATIYIT